MNVRGFLCVSLGSSIVQLHDSLGRCSGAGFRSQMATMLDKYTTDEQFPVASFVNKELNTKAIHK
jgi:hypothetical protein